MSQSDRPLIGMLCWEEETIPSVLRDLSELPGNATNPSTFSFPILYKRIPGANLDTVVKQPSSDLLNSMIHACQEMESEGIRAITTSCGFNAFFQKELVDAVNIPIFTSSLLQIPFVHRMLGASRSIGIITADSSSLTNAHLEAVGVDKSIPLSIVGLEETAAFSHTNTNVGFRLDIEQLRIDILNVIKDLLKGVPTTGAIVLECTDLPPFSNDIYQATGLPVFDIVTLTKFVYSALTHRPLYE